MRKQTEYIELKKRIVETLEKERWTHLVGLILKEDDEFVAEYVEADNTGSALETQLKELATSVESLPLKAEKLK